MNGPKLAAVAPSLFSPGYLEVMRSREIGKCSDQVFQAMKQRNTFMSIIARSLDSIMSRPNANGKYSKANSSSTTLQLLWLLAQRTLHKENSSSNIRTFWNPKYQPDNNHSPDPEILDDGVGLAQVSFVQGSPSKPEHLPEDALLFEECDRQARYDGDSDSEFDDIMEEGDILFDD